MRVGAIVLAAGEGRRMGGPKASLPWRGSTLLVHVAGLVASAGASPVIVVLAPAASCAPALGLPPGTCAVVNERPSDGMLSSVLRGLDAAEAAGAEAALLQPVDHPLVSAATVARVIAALRAGARVAIPSHRGRRGHPGGFAASTWPALRALAPERGARAILSDHPDWITYVPGGRGCLVGLDTPADLRRWARSG